MSVKIFRNGKWEEVDGEYEDNLRTKYAATDASLFVEAGEEFSVSRMGFSLRDNEHTLTGYVVFSTASTLKANSRYYIGRLFPQLQGVSMISFIYNCALCQYNDIGASEQQICLPAVVWTDVDKKIVSIVPLSTATVTKYKAEVEIDFIFNFSQKLASNYIDALFS